MTFGKLANLKTDLVLAEETIAKWAAEIDRIRKHDPAVDKMKRVAKLRDSSAALDLEQTDAAFIRENILMARAQALASHQSAKELLYCIWEAVLETRKANAMAKIEEMFDCPRVPVGSYHPVELDRGVLQIQALKWDYAPNLPRDAHDDDAPVLLAKVRERYDRIRRLAEVEANLTLPDLVRPEEESVEPQPLVAA